MRQIICRGYFAFDRIQMVEMVTWLEQYRETQRVEVSSYGLAYSLPNTDKQPLKACPLKSDFTVSYVGHAFQTCHVITSNKCVQLLTK